MTKSNVKPVPDGMHTVTPHLICAGAADAIEFYKKAFNAVELGRVPGAQGKLLHALIRIGDSAVIGIHSGRSRSKVPRSPSISMSTMWRRSSSKPSQPVRRSRCRSTTCFGEIVTVNSKILSDIIGRLPRMFVM